MTIGEKFDGDDMYYGEEDAEELSVSDVVCALSHRYNEGYKDALQYIHRVSRQMKSLDALRIFIEEELA